MNANEAEVIKIDLSGGSQGPDPRPSAAIVLTVPEGRESEGLKVADRWRLFEPASLRVVLLERMSAENLLLFINRARAFRVYDAKTSEAELAEMLKEAQQLHQIEVARRDLLARAKDQNRQLEKMTSSLEHLVKDRTSSAAESKAEAERRVSHLRNLLIFIKELSTAKSLEDLLLFIRREFKHFHRLGDPCLAYGLSSGSLRLLYLRAGRVHERRAQRGWSESNRLRVNHLPDSQYLANELGRPVNKVLAIPLPVRKSVASLNPTPCLFFEHSMAPAESDEFLMAVSERMQSISIALDRLLLEYDLRTASYLWEHTFDGIEEPVAILDLEHNLLRCNKHFSTDLIMRRCYQNFVGATAACDGCPVPLAISSGEAMQGIVRRGGEVYEAHSYPIIMSAEQKPTSVVNHYVNMTRHLELQEQVIQTEKMAALGHLAGHIAHELNNPLTGIRSLAQVLLAQKVGGPQIQGDLSEIERAAQRSQGIIGNLLDFAGGKSAGKIEDCDLNEIVKRTLPLLKTAMGAHRAEVDFYAEPAWVKVDPQLIQQVIFNLVKNACQSMAERGDLKIEVGVAPHDPQFWRLTVADSGTGIPDSIRQHIFSPFFTTKNEGEGTGLGLSLSLNVVKRFGGTIELESKVGAGTSFFVQLPRMDGPR